MTRNGAGQAASPTKGTEHEDSDRRRSRGGCVDRSTSEAARRVRRDRHPRADHYVSFANCGLPYHIGREIPERDSPLLQTPESLAQSLALDVRTVQEVVRIDRAAKEVAVRDEKKGRTYRESYDKLVLCPGAEPIRPPIPGADDPRVDVLRNIPDMDHIIAHLERGALSAVVVGGSYIGLELTEAFRARGLHTTVVERTERLMPWLDPEMTRILDFHVRTHDVDLRLGTSANAVRRIEGDRFALDLSDGTTIETDVVVMAAGVRPNAGLAKDAGLEIGPLGGIVVDPQMRTSDPDILAAGDAVETPHFLTGEPVLSMLASPANRQGRIAADTIAGRDSEYRGTQGTGIVRVFEMTAGGTGVTETQLRSAGIDYRKVHDHHNGDAAYYPGTSPLFLKVLFAPEDGRLLGGQVLGWEGVDKRVDVLAVAIRAGMTVYDLEHLELGYAPPYGSAKDPLNMVGFLGSNLLRGDIDLCYPEEFPEVVDRVTVLDTRTQAEYDAWHIPGAVLMPYREIRQRLDEVPRDKPVYTYCRSGFRSYIAYCVLRQNGFEGVKFLSGGMMIYHGYHRTPLEVGAGGMPVVAHAEHDLARLPGALEQV